MYMYMYMCVCVCVCVCDQMETQTWLSHHYKFILVESIVIFSAEINL